MTGAWLDNTGEALVAVLRPGSAGSNTAADHLVVLDRALTQLPTAGVKAPCRSWAGLMAPATHTP